MYKLKKLELLGFKSFADRTRLEFADGIAAVVGPNGCGKSNLSDAITWVLGEQSARLLRGERMSDVIFNGSGIRPPTGMSEVSMTLIDPEFNEAGIPDEEVIPEALEHAGEIAAFEPEASGGGNGNGHGNGNGNGNGTGSKARKLRHRAGEITVTRRLFRSGESEYLINGDVCRLRDIQDLFMGTGLGPESYAIIEQGRIGQILSSKPSDRRMILEEAAGVSKFKTRKRLAEAKLESSRQNLARIADILEEVTKQVGSLKRQASKARRYRELFEELRSRLKTVMVSRLKALEAELARLRAELAQAQEACLEAARELDTLEHEQKANTQRHDEMEVQLTQCRERLSQGELERERLLSRVEQVKQQAANLDARSEEAVRESQELQAQLTQLDQQVAERTQQVEQFRQEWTTAKEALAEVQMRQEDLNVQLSVAEQDVDSCRQSLLNAVAHAAELRNQLVQADEAGLAYERQAARTDAEKSRVEAEHLRLAAELEAYISENQRGASVLADLTQSLSQTTQALEQARAEELSLRTQVEALRREYSGSMARKEALEESLARHAYSTESVRRLLSGEIPMNGNTFRPMGLLADFVEVSPGYEEVVEEFLKQELECVVVEQHAQALSGIALLRHEGTGRSTFFVTHLPSHAHLHSGGSLVEKEPGIVAPVRDLVRFEPKLGLNGDVALPALLNAYLVEDDAAAERLASAYPDCHFVTSSGAHYRHRLVSGGKGSNAGPLALRRDFRELERRTAELDGRIKSSELALVEAEERARRLDAELRTLSGSKLEAEKKAVVADEKLRQTREASDRAQRQLSTLLSEAAALRGERARVEERQMTLRAGMETAGQAKAQWDESLSQATTRVRTHRTDLDRLAQEIADAQSGARAWEERTRAAESEAARLDAAGNELRSRMGRLAQQTDFWLQERTRLAQEGDANQLRLEQLQLDLEAARAGLHGLEEESRLIKIQRETLSPRVEAARLELDRRRERRSESEVAQARAESDYAHHAQQCRDELNADPVALLAELEPESVLAGEALQFAEDELRQIKTRIENLGPVNMMALEELQEAEERLTFLDTQRQDLLSSIEDTAQAIREIDQVSRQQFLEAFKAINAYFAESFRTLFGGGNGEMRLADENDADSGIDIVAQPPGKRLQNVLLLSGGEKAMAALALLIAIFRYTPSPFCILDEVDAPLDESNIDRFTRMIQHMSRHTQFILITHNKRTMEIAQVMYGVTMEEPGVSKLVSVRFDAFVPEPVAVPA